MNLQMHIKSPINNIFSIPLLYFHVIYYLIYKLSRKIFYNTTLYKIKNITHIYYNNIIKLFKFFSIKYLKKDTINLILILYIYFLENTCFNIYNNIIMLYFIKNFYLFVKLFIAFIIFLN